MSTPTAHNDTANKIASPSARTEKNLSLCRLCQCDLDSHGDCRNDACPDVTGDAYGVRNNNGWGLIANTFTPRGFKTRREAEAFLDAVNLRQWGFSVEPFDPENEPSQGQKGGE